MKKFPDGFLWGASTASYQVEGGIEYCDWAEAAREGKVPPAGVACDHYNRYEEDWDIAKSLNFTSQRFSIEWSRIEPEEGKFDEKEMQHYKDIVRALKERGLEPFVTIWHWPLPLWLSKKGGVVHKKFPQYLARYAAYIAEHLGTEVRFYITINEPMVVTGHGYISGIWPPFRKNPFAYLRAVSQVVRAHIETYKEVKKVAPHAQLGVSKNESAFEGSNVFGKILASVMRWWYNDRYLNKIRNYQDFIALNHYFRVVFWQNAKQKEEYPKSDLGWELYPPSIYPCLLSLRKYNVPVYISEHGLADADDSRREDFIKESLAWIHKAIEEGIDIRGYSHWSLLDNYEWAEGFPPRFGLVHIDYENNQKRTVRESAKAYAEICKNNAL